MIVCLDRLRHGARVTCLVLYKVKKVTRLNVYFVSLFVCQSFALFSSFCQPLRYTDNRIVNIIKVYIERNNLQVELIGYSNKCLLYSRYFCQATDSM